MKDDSYEFPEYAPGWKQEKSGYFWTEETREAFLAEGGLDEILDEETNLSKRDCVKIMDSLVSYTKTVGPFSVKQLEEATKAFIINRELESLYKKGLLEKDSKGNFKIKGT